VVVVAEDEPKIAAVLADYLRASGFEPRCVADGPAAVEAALVPGVAALLLDLNLPGLDGLEVCRIVRRTSALPILMVTARVDEFDRVLGLEIGADDYVCKPFGPREVVARVRALVRRSEGRLAGQTAIPVEGSGGFAVDAAGQRVLWRDAAINVTPIEFRLLRALLAQPGRVFERTQLLDLLHEDFRDVSDRAIDSHVKNLRRKLAAVLPEHNCIVAVYGHGYRFDPPGGAAGAG
jgi:two-component system response regulator BaeR